LSDEIVNVECFQGIILYGKLKALADALDYIRKFVDCTVVFDKRSAFKLYICSEDGKPVGKYGGDRAR
jgi:hypothetical protein